MYSKFGTRRSTFQKRTYKILISDFKLSIKNLRTKPNKAFHCSPSVYEHAWLRTWACRFILIRVTVTPITAPSFPTVDWWQTENLIKFQTSLIQFNMFKIQFKDYLHSLFHFPSWNQFLILTFTYMYICSISTKELDSLNLKKLICSHARGFKLRWLKKLKEIAIWKVSLNPVEHLDLLYPGSSNPNPIQDLHREGHCSMI